MNKFKTLFLFLSILVQVPAFTQEVWYDNRGYARVPPPSSYRRQSLSDGPFQQRRRAEQQPGDPMLNNEERRGIVGASLGALTAGALGGNGFEVLLAGVAGGAINSRIGARQDRKDFEARVADPRIPCEVTVELGNNRGDGHNRASDHQLCTGTVYRKLPENMTNTLPDPGIATYDHAQETAEPVDALSTLPPEEQALVLTHRSREEMKRVYQDLPVEEKRRFLEEAAMEDQPELLIH